MGRGERCFAAHVMAGSSCCVCSHFSVFAVGLSPTDRCSSPHLPSLSRLLKSKLGWRWPVEREREG